MKKYPPISYSDYLKVNELTDLQSPRSLEYKQPAHDEMLFIIVHQTYELWFKQILTELDSVREIFSQGQIDETDMGTAVARLERITEIQRVLVDQVSILETMTPLDFLDFRDFLYPASGFQSVQFRLIENRLGLLPDSRLPFNALPYHSFVSGKDSATMKNSEQEESIFELVDKWLERTPFLETEGFQFWQHYQAAVRDMFNGEKEIVLANKMLKDEERARVLLEIKGSEDVFDALFNESKYEELRRDGHWRLSYRAVHAAMLINLYRNQPVLQLPFRLIVALQNIDELMANWRYRHSLMAHRMLGNKIGTGGSTGAKYLKAATDKHRIFSDFFNLATFLIPRSVLPELPIEIKLKLGFHYSAQTAQNP